MLVSDNLNFIEEMEEVAVDSDLNRIECIRIFPPEKAVAEAVNNDWSLAVVDLYDPKASLLTVAGLKQANSRIPIIVMVPSGFHNACALMNAGAMDVLSKSQLDKPLLRQKIIFALERQRIEDEIYHRDNILEAVNFAAENFLLDPDWEKSIDEVLERLGKATNSDRVYIFKNGENRHTGLAVSLEADWAGMGIEPKKRLIPIEVYTYEDAGYQRWREILSSGSIIHGNIEEFPAIEQPPLMKMGVKSLIIAPIFIDQTWWGFIGFDQCLQARGWTHIQADALKTAASIFGAALSRQAAEKRLTFLATHDYLTNLPNRMLFEDRFRQAAARAQRSREKIAIISLDLDKFKSVNDSFGHPAGDAVLVDIAQRLVQALRSSDTCARIGGDEFGVLAETIHNKGDVMRVMEKISQAFIQPLWVDGKSIQISASMGAALFPDNGSDLDSIMKAADKALYEVKGKQATFRIFDNGQYSFIED